MPCVIVVWEEESIILSLACNRRPNHILYILQMFVGTDTTVLDYYTLEGINMWGWMGIEVRGQGRRGGTQRSCAAL